MKVDIIRARPSDAPFISAILSDWIEETDWMPSIHSEEEVQGYGSWLIEISDVTVACIDDRVVGFLSRQNSEVHALYLASGYRRKGIGADLLNNAKSQIDSLGLWTFQANKPAQDFYLNNDFREDKRTNGSSNDEKLPDIRYIWLRKQNE